jgi:hypothetical protein
MLLSNMPRGIGERRESVKIGMAMQVSNGLLGDFQTCV